MIGKVSLQFMNVIQTPIQTTHVRLCIMLSLGLGSSWGLVFIKYHSHLFLPSSIAVVFIVCVSGYLEYFALHLTSLTLQFLVQATMVSSVISGSFLFPVQSPFLLRHSLLRLSVATLQGEHMASLSGTVDVLSRFEMGDEHLCLRNFLSVLILSCQNLAYLRNAAKSFAFPLL